MSNVLIGIIGVILFIGLALAGALFLGPRFQEATNSSKASAIMTSVKQLADAAELQRLDSGSQYTRSGQPTFLVSGGYLKAVPTNPAPAATAAPDDYRWKVVLNNNIYADASEVTEINAAKYAQAAIGPETDTQAASICAAIAKTHGRTSVETYANTVDPWDTSGCIKVDGNYVAFTRIAPVSQSVQIVYP